MPKVKNQSKNKKPVNRQLAEIACAVPSCNSLISCIRKGKPLPTSTEEGGVKMSCTNIKCEYAKQLVHDTCFQHFEDFLVKLLGKRGSARNWTENQRRINLWEKKGIVLVTKFLTCHCGLGYMTRDVEFHGKSNVSPPASPDIKHKKKTKKSLPTLNLGVKNTASVSHECSSAYKKKAKELDHYYLSNPNEEHEEPTDCIPSIASTQEVWNFPQTPWVQPNEILAVPANNANEELSIAKPSENKLTQVVDFTSCSEDDAKPTLVDHKDNVSNVASALQDMQKSTAQPKVAIVESVQRLKPTPVVQKEVEEELKKQAVAPTSWAELFNAEPELEPTPSKVDIVDKSSTKRFVSIQEETIEIAEICAVLELRLKGFKSLFQSINGDSAFIEDENCFDSLPFFSPQTPSIKWQLKVYPNGQKECGEFGTNVHLNLHQLDVLDCEKLTLAQVHMYFLNVNGERVDVTFVGRDAPIYYFRLSHEHLLDAFFSNGSLLLVCEVEYLALIEENCT